jgi:hypothetical protein
MSFLCWRVTMQAIVRCLRLGVTAPSDGYTIDLGGTFVTTTTESTPLPPAAQPSDTPVNALFVEALDLVPAEISISRPAAYRAAIAPFSLESLVTDLTGSQADIGALAVVGLGDGSILYSGGADRGWLYRISSDGVAEAEPFARLGEPIYDLALGKDGRLWATTGGNALVELEPETGSVLGRFGDSITQSVAIADDGTIYVSTADGIAIFNPEDGSFTVFADRRVDDLAFAPDGTLWGTSWPERGQVYSFDADGKASLIADIPSKIDSLTFGQEGSEFEGLALLTSNGENGVSKLFALDLASHQTLSIAAGNVRGEGIVSLADGRVVIAHSDGLDVMRPLRAPDIIATSIEDGDTLSRPVSVFSIQFNEDMVLEGEGSVLDPFNYALVDGSGTIIPITDIIWDAELRAVTLSFAPLDRGVYVLNISENLLSTRGIALGEPRAIEFSRLDNITASVDVQFADTRYDRLAGTISYDVIITNTGDFDLVAPMLLTLDPASPDGNGIPFAGVETDGIWLIDLSAALGENGVLAFGESATAQTVTLILEPGKRADFAHGVRILPSANQLPEIYDDIPRQAKVGELFTHTLTTVDADGTTFGYVLVSAPEGLEIDPATGVISWVPGAKAKYEEAVVIRAYDTRGGYAEASFTLTIEGANNAPTLEQPASVIEIAEGETLRLPYLASDPDGDLIALFADNLPAGATLDHAAQELIWTPLSGQAGLYRNVAIGATDGDATTMRMFDIRVRPTDFAPIVAQPPVQVIREGDPLRYVFSASDPEGKALTFSTAFLPANATLNPNTGVFEWTPGFTQNGQYDIPVFVSDGERATQVTLSVEVINANGAPILDGFGDWRVTEGQVLAFRTEGIDPDNPSYVLPERDADGNLIFFDGSERVSTTYAITGLPDGATYDADTGTFRWETGFESAGSYVVTLTATDDGDGTGNPLVSEIDITIVVDDFNRPPAFPDLPNRTMNAGETLTIPLSSVDPDGNLLTFTATATRAASSNQINLDPTPIPLDGSNGFGEIVATADGFDLVLSPALLDRGDWIINLRVDDEGNGDPSRILSDEASFILSVDAPNIAPVLQPVGGLVAVVGEELVFTFKASDLDRDPLIFSTEGLPDGAVLEQGSVYGEATLRFTPEAGDIGTYTATLNVRDSGSGDANAIERDSITFTFNVRGANEAPVLQPIGTLNVAELATLDVLITANDPDGDGLTFTASNLPQGAMLDPVTGRLTFTPNQFQAGIYDDIIISVTDGHKTASETISIVVANTNRAPTFLQTPTQRGRETTELTFRLLAADVDNESVRFQLQSALPAGARFNSTTGEFNWTPSYTQAGSYTLKVAAVDPSGLQTVRDIAIEIADTNRAPQPVVENRAVVLGETLDIVLTATDPDNDDTPTLSIENLPFGASFDPVTGRFIFTPGVAELGDHILRVVADDGTDRTVASMVLRVTREAVPPTATLDLTPSFPALPGQAVTISTAASGFVPIVEKRLFVNGLEIDLDALGRGIITAGQPGKVDVLLVVTDADGRVGTATKTIAIRDANDNSAPFLSLPIDDGDVLASGSVFGGVSDASLDQWRLSLIHAQSGRETVLASGEDEISGVLADFDPASVPSGFYTLRLEARDVSGLRSIIEKQVEVLPEASNGLSLTTTDASVVIGGTTFDLTRSYDSRLANSFGDFGGGWTALWRDVNLDAGPAMQAGKALSEGDRLHLTAPDGTRVVFTVHFEAVKIAGFEQLNLVFESDTSGYSLTHDGALLVGAEGKAYSAASGLPYNPFTASSSRFTLTDNGGTEWTFDGKGAVKQIAKDGARLLVADSGIIGEDGTALNLITETNGAIGGVELPDGTRLVYLYDTQGRLSFVGGSATAEPVTYGYEAMGSGRLIGAVSDNAGTAYNYDDNGVAALSLDQHLGTIAQATAGGFNKAVDAGNTVRTSFVVRESELRSVQGEALIRVALTGDAGVDGLTLNGMAPLSIETTGGQTIALFAIDTKGLQRFDVVMNEAGSLAFDIRVAGDVNGDGSVGSADLASFEINPSDLDGDGVIDASDRALLLQNFGFAANLAPVLAIADQKTYQNLPLTIGLGDAASDPEGDPIFYKIEGAVGGIVGFGVGSSSLIFTPDNDYSGPAKVTIRAGDGYTWSEAYDIAITISDAALEAIDFEQRMPHLATGEVRQFKAFGTFADGGTALLPQGYVQFAIGNPAIVEMNNSRLKGLTTGYTTLTATRGDVGAATVVKVGALEGYDETLSLIGVDAYPDAIILDPGSTRQLLLFDPGGDNVLASDTDNVMTYVVNGSIVEVTPDGLVKGLAAGETEITIIYRATEILVPVRVIEPVIGENVPVGAEGGVVRNADGYQVGIGEGAFNRTVDVSINTLDQSDIPLDSLPEEQGWTFGAAFELDIDNAPMDMPAQIAVPTSLAEGTKVIFYRVTDFLNEDGTTTKGYQEVETGIVDANGVARTTSPPHLGVDTQGQFVLYGVDNDKIRQIDGSLTVSGSAGSVTKLVRSIVPGPLRDIVVGVLNAAANFVLNVPPPVRDITVVAFNADSQEFISSKQVALNPGEAINNLSVRLVGGTSAAVTTGLNPRIASASVDFGTSLGISDVFIDIQGDNLVSAGSVVGSDTFVTQVIFGNVSRVELENKLRELSNSGADVPDILRFANGVAVKAENPNGGTDIRVKVPRDVEGRSFRVAKIELGSYAKGDHKPSKSAIGSSAGGSFLDIKARISEAFTLQPTGRETFVAVTRGIIPGDEAVVKVTKGAVDQLAVIRSPAEGLPGLVGRIPVGHLLNDGTNDISKPTAAPDQAVLTSDYTRVYVGLEQAGGIAAVDAVLMRQIDIDPDKDGINFIELVNAPNARIGEIVIDASENFLLAADRGTGKIYVINIDPSSPLYHKHVATWTLEEAEWGVRGMTITPDNTQLVVTQGTANTGNNAQGLVAIYDLPDLQKLAGTAYLAEFLRETEGVPQIIRDVLNNQALPTDLKTVKVFRNHAPAITLVGGRIFNPQAVKVAFAPPGADGDLRAIVLDAGRNGRIAALKQFISVLQRTDDGQWSLERSFEFVVGDQDEDDIFDVSDATDVVFSPDGKDAYIIGQKRWLQGDYKRDPNLTPPILSVTADDNPPGTNVAIVKDIFRPREFDGFGNIDNPVVAATRMIPYSWGRDIGMTTEGRHIVMSGGASGTVLLYDPQAINAMIDVLGAEDAGNYPIDDYDENGRLLYGRPFTPADRETVNTDIGVRAAYGLFGEVLGPSPTQLEHAPILTGGYARGVATPQGSFIKFGIPEGGAFDSIKPTFKIDLNNRNAEIGSLTITLAVAAPGSGLFTTDSSPELAAALAAVGFKDQLGQDGNLLEGALPVGDNRNRILTYTIYAKDFEGGILPNEITVPAALLNGRDLTRGQTYWWGVEAKMKNWTDEGSVRAARSFRVEPAPGGEASGSFAGVTVMTHGFSAPVFGAYADQNALFDMAERLAAQTNAAILMYDPSSDGSYGPWTHVKGTALVESASSLILMPDWIVDSGVNDSGFAEAAGDAFYASILKLNEKLPNLLSSPLHFIGQGRGAVVNTEITQRLLARHGQGSGSDITLGDIQSTTIDPYFAPQPQIKFPLSKYITTASTISLVGSGVSALAGQPQVASALYRLSGYLGKANEFVNLTGFNTLDYSNFYDPIVTNWDGIGFADNYYQSVADATRLFSLTPRGIALPSADINMNLNGLPGFFEDDSSTQFTLSGLGINNKQYGIGWGTVHDRAVTWYAGTASLQSNEIGTSNTRFETVWRQASDRFLNTPDYWALGGISRYYNDPEEGSQSDAEGGASGYDMNTTSWYRAREFEVSEGNPAFIFNPNGKASFRGLSDSDQGPWEGIGTGWFYSSLGGGSQFTSAISKGSRTDPETPFDDNTLKNPVGVAIKGVFNGDFEESFRPFYGRVPIPGYSYYEIPGWSFHGGGSSGGSTWLQGVSLAGVSGLNYEWDYSKLKQAGIEVDPGTEGRQVLDRILSSMRGFASFETLFKNGTKDPAALLGGFFNIVGGTLKNAANIQAGGGFLYKVIEALLQEEEKVAEFGRQRFADTYRIFSQEQNASAFSSAKSKGCF